MNNLIWNSVSPYKALPSSYSPEDLQKQLIKAVQRDDVDLIRLWIGKGAKVDTKDELGNAPLHIAVLLGHVRSVVMLLEAHASPLEKNGEAKSAIQLAQEQNSHAIIRLLDQSLESAKQDHLFETDLNKQELLLLDAIGSAALEEDVISTAIVSVKSALRLRKHNPAIEGLIKKLKQPWHLHQQDWKGKKHAKDIPDNAMSGHYAIIQKLSKELKDAIAALSANEIKRRKNEAICAELHRIDATYQSFINLCCQANNAQRQILIARTNRCQRSQARLPLP